MKFTGERFVPEKGGDIKLEHLHRYLLACEISKSKFVLDIACGEGYGSDMLAESAYQVIGVDISAEAINHARKHYKKQNLEFKIGHCGDIPLPSSSIDLVVSFETIEHHQQHEEMMLEIQRVLKPDGVLLISNPDKYYYSIETGSINPFHVKELYAHEFKSLLAKYFANINYYGQRIIFGSGIFPESSSARIINYWQEYETIKNHPGIFNPLYGIALASNTELPQLSAGMLEQPINDSEIIESWSKLVQEKHVVIEMQDAQLVEKDMQLAEKDMQLAEKDMQLAEKDMQLTEINSQVDVLKKLIYQYDSSNSWKITAPLRVLGQWFKQFNTK